MPPVQSIGKWRGESPALWICAGKEPLLFGRTAGQAERSVMSASGKLLLFLAVFAAVGLGALWILGSRPVESQAQVEILASPEEVFGWLTEADKRVQWVSGLRSIQVAESNDQGQPRLWKAEYVQEGTSATREEQILQFEPHSFLSVRSRQAGTTATRVYRLESDAGKVRLKIEGIESAAGLGKFRFAVSSVDLAPGLSGEAQRLKRLVEKNRNTPTVFGSSVGRDDGHRPD